MCKHKVTGTKPENNTKADLVPIKLFYDTLAQVQDRANSLANPEYDDGCQAFLVYLEHFLFIYVNVIRIQQLHVSINSSERNCMKYGIVGGSAMRRRYQLNIGQG